MGISDLTRVIAAGPKDSTSIVHRFYGVVIRRSGDSLTIKLADGSTIRRRTHSVAVYIQSPPNWERLYRQQEVLTERNKGQSRH